MPRQRIKNKFKDRKSMSTEQVLLTDDTLTRIETTTEIKQYDRVLSFYDLEEAVEVEQDDFTEVPWKDWDGWDHELVAVPEGVDASDAEGYIGSRGRDGFHGVDWNETSGDTDYVVRADPRPWGNEEWARKRGASKQTAKLYADYSAKQANRQLSRWMRNGWETYVVSLTWDQYSESLGGIMDDDGDYLEQCKRDIALQVAHQMEKDGFLFEDMPQQENEPKLTAKEWTRVGSKDGPKMMYVDRSYTADMWKKEWQRHLHEQDAQFDDDCHRRRRSMRRHAWRHRHDKK